MMSSNVVPAYQAIMVYQAMLNQNGTNAPTALVMQNTIRREVTLTRVSAGFYDLRWVEPVDPWYGRMAVFVSTGDATKEIKGSVLGPDGVQICTVNQVTGVPEDNTSEIYVRIEIYNQLILADV